MLLAGKISDALIHQMVIISGSTMNVHSGKPTQAILTRRDTKLITYMN